MCKNSANKDKLGIMLAKDLISQYIPVLKTSDTGEQALTLMEVYRVSHLPIVNNSVLLGLVSDKDIYDLKMPAEAIGNHQLSLSSPHIYESRHIYEVLEMFSSQELTLLPVLNANEEYLGAITLRDLAWNFSKLVSGNGPGGILVIEVKARDYSMSIIARIIEENSAGILSFYVNPIPETELLQITLKLNVEDLTSIIKSFERYDYTVHGWFSNATQLDNTLQDRYDSLMRYLEI